MRAVWVAKYQPPPSTSAVGASATGAPSPSRTVRSAHRAANSASWVATSTAAPAAASSRSRVGERVLVAAVHAARRLVEADHGGRLALQDDREREPLALAAGEVARVAVGECGEAGGLERLGGQLLPHPLGDQVVAGVLQQQRHAPAARDPAAGRLVSPAASRSSVDLPAPLRPISATRSPGREREVHAAQHRRARAGSRARRRSNASATGAFGGRRRRRVVRRRLPRRPLRRGERTPGAGTASPRPPARGRAARRGRPSPRPAAG